MTKGLLISKTSQVVPLLGNAPCSPAAAIRRPNAGNNLSDSFADANRSSHPSKITNEPKN
eukprot:CAMPEP_0174289556 /NCGR_PEP_ID=MMETSP0809-20121228/25469_1 /TAXON_ID=73025 ORGANISM="Eutreptiella gymnastica-like, Strain CCMP1594" /NCGR_SAMPLE_ID=MMETSP0809 /ASSEMBLY_ACC=CAM_ASM_000658 /LENGTH=59 /DNA_ID=CAMNT_0015387583 /DNA_START=878 /DNA_END=1057 /DNA_ORIENTATION=+